VEGSAFVATRKLSSTDAFVVVDLPDAPIAAGVARLAPKILVDGASWQARSQTYQFAAFGRKASGASAGINVRAEERGPAIEAFSSELLADVRAGRLGLEAGRGLGLEDLADLQAADVRPDEWWAEREQLRAAGVAASAAVAVGGSLDGRTVAVEGVDAAGLSVVRALIDQGASVVAVGTSRGAVVGSVALDPDALEAAWMEHGADMVTALGGDDRTPGAVLGAAADVLVVGSKAGAVDHELSGLVRASAVVPWGPIPVTAKALAELRRAGVTVVPDFVATGGHLVAWPDVDAAPVGDLRAAAAESVAGVLGEVMDHPSGPLLGACEQAEAFLATWCDELPFGRPLA
jgi:glutamate dehydrogenase (NAD(P)+)